MTGFKIEVPQDYFARSAAKDYADDAGMALIREFAQNACDAGASVATFTFGPDNVLTVEDNGRGCDDRRMRNKLLVPLESEKEGESVGGFGKAKELLLFGNRRWVLRTRDLRVVGSLLAVESYEQGLEHFGGFRAEVTLPEGLYRAAKEQARRFLRRSERPGVKWVLDGEVVECDVERAHRAARDFGFAKAYVRRDVTDSNVYLRTKGLLTAIRWGHHSSSVGQVVIEVTGPSTEVLTPARDWFRSGEHRAAVEGWLHSLVVAATKTLREDEGDEIIFDDAEVVEAHADDVPRFGSQIALPRAASGERLAVSFRASLPPAAPTLPQAAVVAQDPGQTGQESSQGLGMVPAQARVQVAAPARRDGFDTRLMPRLPGVHRVVVRTGNKRQAKVAMRWLRKPRYQARAARLLAAWTTAVRAIAKAAGHRVDAVGFSFGGEVEGEFVRTGNGRFGLLINPLAFAFKGRYQAHEVLDIALHEAAHQVASIDHDESFVNGEVRLRRAARDPRILRAIARALRSGQVEDVAL